MTTPLPSFGWQVDRARSTGGVLLAAIMMSVDGLNPVKVVCGVISVPSYYAAYPFAILLMYLVWTQMQELAYFFVRVFFTSILSIFFSKIEVIGRSNVPRDGPLIFTGNHANQYVDALQVITSCRHRVGFLVARKSYNHPIVGFFARAVGCIPVNRAQDTAISQPKESLIQCSGKMVEGRGMKFTGLVEARDKIRFRGHHQQLKVKNVVSDTELELMDDCPDELEGLGWWEWDLLKYESQGSVYESVYQGLSEGKCIVVFPEGGSHDRTDLLPIKAGVALIAFGTMEKHNMSVPIVPIGLSYFRGHRFRGRCVVEFGPPICVSSELFNVYKRDKREACNTLLHQIEGSMRSCLVTAPDYETLRLIYTARRLYQPKSRMLSPEQKQDLNRRFAYGYKIMVEKYAREAGVAVPEGKPLSDEYFPEEIRNLKQRLIGYRNELNELGLRDYQVPTLASTDTFKDAYTAIHLFLSLLLASLPSIILNAPVGLVARIVAARERERALAGSVVKLYGRDIMMSQKIMISMIMVPLLWLCYIAGLLFFSGWDVSLVLLAAVCMPVFSYVGVVAVEAGMVDAKDLKPLVIRMRAKERKAMLDLPKKRRKLRKDLIEFVAKVEPDLGEVYSMVTTLFESSVSSSIARAFALTKSYVFQIFQIQDRPIRWDQIGRRPLNPSSTTT